jgi:hypothetical protein
MIQQWKPTDAEQDEIAGSSFPSDTLDLNSSGDKTTPIATFGRRSIAWQITQATGSWTTAVVEVMGTINGTDWVDLGGTDISAVGLSGKHDITGVRYVCLNVKTVEGSASTVTVWAWATTDRAT